MKYICSTSIPGGNQVDGLPPAFSLKFSEKSQIRKFRRKNEKCVKFEHSFAFRSLCIHTKTKNYFASDGLSPVSNGRIFEVVWYMDGSAHEHHMNAKIWIGMIFHVRAIWDQPWAGNQATKSKLRVRAPQNHPKLRKWENREKHAKTSGFIDFSTFKMNFRSAD